MKKLIEKTFSSDEVAVFLGEKEVAQKLLDLPFNHIMFTGSPRVGKLVMEYLMMNSLNTSTLFWIQNQILQWMMGQI